MMLGLYRTSRKEAFLSVLTIVIVLAATIVTLTEFGSFGTAQGQGNLTIGNLTLTPEQKAAYLLSAFII
jgi:hypothetical protein